MKKTFIYRNPDVDAMIDTIINTYLPGIYVVGLSNHVGFLLLKEAELYFIHSNYSSPAEVIIQIAQDSDVLRYSDVFHITAISNNEALLKKWLWKDYFTISN